MKSLRTFFPPALACRIAVALVIAAVASGASAQTLGPNLKQAASTPRGPSTNGFMQRWLVLEPIRIPIRSNAELGDSYVQATLKKEYFTNQFTVVPRDGVKVTVNGTELAWHAVDSSTYNIDLYHFAGVLGKPQNNVVFWAVTIVNCSEEIPNVRLAVGSNASSIWWLNGKEVVDLYGDIHMVPDDGVSKRLTLHKGRNILRGAVINSPGTSYFCARFLDEDGKPVLSGFTLSTVEK
jgi:hypothetical protein